MSVPKGTLQRVRFYFATRALTASELSAFQVDGSLPSGVGIDPTVVKFDHRAPGSVTTTTLTYPNGIVKDFVGSYHVDIDTSVATSIGMWDYRGYGTGTGQAITEGNFEITTLF